jgi:putative phosphoribosyl transferase
MILSVHQYRDRVEAGQLLGRQLAHYASRVDSLVLGVPRGGVPIAVEVASYLNAPLDAFLVRPLVLPGENGVTIGAITSGGVNVYDDEVVSASGLSADELETFTARETAELKRLERRYRGVRAPAHVSGRLVILVADSITNGPALHAAVIALHRLGPAWLVVAAPVGTTEACDELAQEVHEVVCPLRPDPLQSIGLCYDHFPPVDDDEVCDALRRHGGMPQS